MSDFFLPVGKASGGGADRKSRKRRGPPLNRKGAKRQASAQPKESWGGEELSSDDDVTSKVVAREVGRGDRWGSGGKQRAASDEEEEAVDEEEAGETPDERRVRLARQYLKVLEERERERAEEEGEEEEEEEEGLGGRVGQLLQSNVRRVAPNFAEDIASRLSGAAISKPVRVFRGHDLSLTCIALSADSTSMFTGGKDCRLIKYDVESGERIRSIGSRHASLQDGCHTAAVTSVAVSSDGDVVATGCADHMVRVWDARSLELIKVLKGHRDVVSGVSFRPNSRQLFSCSHDSTVKVWNAEIMAYAETLYGHQSAVRAIDTMSRYERALTVGEDCTCRLWKVAEESQLMFRGQSLSIDCCAHLNEELFFTGSQDGSLGMWSTKKRKPLFVAARTHATREPIAPWISSVACVRKSNLVASGSSAQGIKIWKFDQYKPNLRLMTIVPLVGFVNGLAFEQQGRFVVAAVGQEHRLGRWQRIPAARNRVYLYDLEHLKQSNGAIDGGEEEEEEDSSAEESAEESEEADEEASSLSEGGE